MQNNCKEMQNDHYETQNDYKEIIKTVRLHYL